MNRRPNWKSQTVRKTIRVNLHDLEFGNGFLEMT